MRTTAGLNVLALTLVSVQSFAPSTNPSRPTIGSNTQLSFGIPGFFTPKNEDEEQAAVDAGPNEEKKIDFKGIVQLITAGAGAPFLGDYQGIDPETGNFMFSLEANNLVDEEGNSKQTQMPYFESGWVDPEDQAKVDAKKGKGGFKFW
eukprot:CAMPEP_0198137604 /NCGR_PEP_ID=MMETSP1443-20131203/1080_1 /TAXON_ID=186043 /ORGANISM="Entomoneis sp., Strain CCMP2396" /LENGTH=147 /DNA_ID=CAMNT_0043799093 /DNA_START=127 /DNA_END=570 /DNA_ORIENTATION=-